MIAMPHLASAQSVRMHKKSEIILSTSGDEEEFKGAPILSTISARFFGAYEAYFAFSQIKGNASQTTLGMTFLSMKNICYLVQAFIKKRP